MNPLTERIIHAIRKVPAGCVATYGEIAARAGNPQAARQVARVLHTCTRSHHLPWHRIVGSGGHISLKGEGFDEQKRLLEAEGVTVTSRGAVDLNRFGIPEEGDGPLI